MVLVHVVQADFNNGITSKADLKIVEGNSDIDTAVQYSDIILSVRAS